MFLKVLFYCSTHKVHFYYVGISWKYGFSHKGSTEKCFIWDGVLYKPHGFKFVFREVLHRTLFLHIYGISLFNFD